MDTQLTENPDEGLGETPEDVAILYSWANLHGAKYRDFSASRREYRAQVRHRAAEELRESELQAKAEAEAAAAEAERVAREAERAAASPASYSGSAQDRERALQEAETAARRAAAERVEAARRAEAAALAESQARREEREIAEAHASAQRQAARYAESESRRRYAAGPQPRPAGLQSDPYEYAQGSSVDNELYTPNRSLEYTQPIRFRDEPYGSRASGERRLFRPVEPEYRRRPQGYRPDEPSGVRPAFRSAGPAEPARRSYAPEQRQLDPYSDEAPRTDQRQEQRRQEYGGQDFPRPDSSRQDSSRQDFARQDFARQDFARPDSSRPDSSRQDSARPDSSRPDFPRPDFARPEQPSDFRPDPRLEQYQASRPTREVTEPLLPQDQSTPAWLYAGGSPASTQPQSPAPGSSSVANTLQHSRERVASRWYALKGVFEAGQEQEQADPVRRQEARTPVLAVFSLAGGVGKTSLVATLGRTLSSLGEKVLLADTTSHGLLPYYFGATELRPGSVRTFSPPAGSTDAPIYLVSYDVHPAGERQGDPPVFAQELTRAASGTNRVLLDLNGGSGWVIRRLPGLAPTVLVPVAPDMNSVISLQAVERYFAGAVDSDGRAILPFYVLNQFDATLPLHLDVREVLRRQLGERLLPIVIRRSQAVSEALAEGMTVVDYAQETAVAEDYMNIAGWLRSLAAPATQGFRNARWSER